MVGQDSTHLGYISMLIFSCSIRKTYKERPNLAQLLEHPFIVNSSEEYVDVAAYVTNVLEIMKL